MIAGEKNQDHGNSSIAIGGELVNSYELLEMHRKNRQRMTRNRNKSGITHNMFDRTAVLLKFSRVPGAIFDRPMG